MTHRNRKPSPPDQDVVTIGADPWETLWDDVLPDVTPAGPPPGDGWKTAVEVSESRRIARKTADEHLRNACERGTMERVKRRIGSKGVLTYFYRPTAAKNDFSRKTARTTR